MLLFNRFEYNPNTDLIGKGAFSRVYKAIDIVSNQIVAIKLHKPGPGPVTNLPLSEYSALSSLDHANICRYIAIESLEKEDAFGETEKIQVAVTRLYKKGNISTWYAESRNTDELKKLLSDTLRGLNFLHENGIIHRNIKPSNILIQENEDGLTAQIADYALSNSSRLDDPNAVSGLTMSIPYMAPEQFNPQKYGIDEKISFNIDLWSLGITVYEILTGDVLFKTGTRESSEHIMKNILSEKLPEKINLLPQPFKEFTLECLVKDAKLRVKTAKELYQYFDLPVIDFLPQPEEEQMQEMTTEIVLKTQQRDDTQTTNMTDDASVTSNDTQIITKSDKEEALNDVTQVLSQAVNATSPPDETKIITQSDKLSVPEHSPTSKLSSELPALAPRDQQEGSIILFNRYEYLPITDLIGKGGFSRVYRAYDKKLSRWVALKIYKTNDLSDRYSPFAEIKRVINLDHGNICRYLDIEEMENVNPFGENEKIQVCVMELLDSGNIAEYYKAHPDPDILKKLLQDILNGLSYLHKKGIIHRDIKPANILIKEGIEGPVAKITDFGISKASDSVSNNSSSALIVSIPFMAPEQFNVKKYGINEKISFNLDLWSLGVTVYEVFTGKVLFKDNEQDNSEQIMANIMAPELPEKVNQLPHPFKEVVSHCLVKNARERAQKAEELMVFLNSKTNNAPPATEEKQDVKPTQTQLPEKTELNNEELTASLPPLIYNDKTKTAGEVPQMAQPAIRHFSFEAFENETPTSKTATKKGYKKYYLFVIGILLLLVYFLFIRKYMRENEMTENTLPSDSAQSTIETKAADTLIKKTNGISDSFAITTGRANALENTWKSNNNVEINKDNTSEKRNEGAQNNQQRNSRQSNSREKNNTAQKLLLELTTTEACKLFLDGSAYADLTPGFTLKAYLKPGIYTLQAISTVSNKEYHKIITVKPLDINTSTQIRIAFR